MILKCAKILTKKQEILIYLALEIANFNYDEISNFVTSIYSKIACYMKKYFK